MHDPQGGEAAAQRAAGERSPEGPPAEAGYSWPAEWEEHAASWLAWPHNEDTWPGRLDAARAQLAAFVRELAAREPVNLLVADEPMGEQARRTLREAGADPDRVAFHHVSTDDAWLRDSGPIFLVRERGGARERALADFRFDCWGRKYEPWDRDDAVPAALERILALPRFRADFVLEGGAVEGDGAGTVLTTESCLLNENRGPGRNREAMERRLADWLSAERVLWLGSGIAGDDTDGHVDDVTRFAAPGLVVTAVEPDASDPNHAPLAGNLRRLRGLRDARGRRLEVATLPMPPPLVVDGERRPASYANFVFANGAVLAPTFGTPSDARALAILRGLFPGRDVVGVRSEVLVVGLGGLHCLSQQEPA